jgi:hypothetical protein
MDPDDRRLSAEENEERLVALAAAVPGGVEAVTRERVERAGCDWRDWSDWVEGLLDHQERNQALVGAYAAIAEYEPPSTVKGRLGLMHRTDSDLGRYWASYWKNHPDEKPPE